jgi:hypothetical protein
MTYGFVLDVPAPIEVYDALHAEIVRRQDPTSCGMLVHIGWPTPEGFQVIEIWESQEQQERFNAEVVEPAMAQLPGGQPPSAEPVREEFAPRGLIIRSVQVPV